jgi:putative redox protein
MHAVSFDFPNIGYHSPEHRPEGTRSEERRHPFAFGAKSGFIGSMVKIEIDYQGQLLTEVTHGPSGIKLNTDAPLDNGGRASSFSPTDLVGAALGSCMATIMGSFAQRHSIPIEGTKIEVVKTMIQQPIRRIGQFKVDIYLPVAADHPQRVGLETAALTCPVHQSLHPDVKIPVTFHWSAPDNLQPKFTVRSAHLQSR